jgi:hypothetical protein
MSDSQAYSFDSMERSFKILPLVGGAYVLSIDSQWTGFFGKPEDAASDCANGHVATFVAPINPEKPPLLVDTSKLTFPAALSGWTRYSLPEQEFSS